jgi:hypothetical protein
MGLRFFNNIEEFGKHLYNSMNPVRRKESYIHFHVPLFHTIVRQFCCYWCSIERFGIIMVV